MRYREIIIQQIQQLQKTKKTQKQKQQNQRTDYFIHQLIADLIDYETKGTKRWPLEPMDKARQKYSQPVDIREILKRLFGIDPFKI